MESPFKAITKHWLEKIKLSLEHKSAFQESADECMRFFNGPYDFLYNLKFANLQRDFVYAGSENMPRPTFCMTHNKAAEMVQIFGPVLYHRNPIRTITPRMQFSPPMELLGNPQDPYVQAAYLQMEQQAMMGRQADKSRGDLVTGYLNYTPTALDLKTNSRRAVDEALIKGMGLLWTEVYRPPGSQFKFVGSFYDSVDNFTMDHDSELREDCRWQARYCLKPIWQVEQEYGLPRDTLKGKGSNTSASGVAEDAVAPKSAMDKQGENTNDLIGYWTIWSKMGIGGLLKGIDKSVEGSEKFGRFCKIVVCQNVEYPLNVPPAIWGNPEAVMQALSWETPFWADDAWPASPLMFHEVPRQIWPMSHLKPAMGELKFLNWAYSFVASKIGTSSRDFIAVLKGASEEIKSKILTGADYTLIEIEKAFGTISEVVQFLQHPPFQADIWKVIMAVSEVFDKRVGLTELMYGTTTNQMRSAEEAAVKSDQLRVRPDDMANKVEDWMTDVARREGLGARWNLEPQDVEPVLGPVGAMWWQQLVTPQDPTTLMHQMEFRIEAGSARKPNKDKMVNDAVTAMQSVFAPLLEVGMGTGQLGPVNEILGMWAKAHDIEPGKLLLQPPPPPDPNQPSPEQMQAQTELMQTQQEMQLDQVAADQELKQKEKSFQQELKHMKAKHEQEIAILKKKKSMMVKPKAGAA